MSEIRTSRTTRSARTTSRVDRRTMPGIRNRRALLDAATQLFRAGDCASISIRDICSTAGVGLGTFYNHFKDKEEILRAILNEGRAESLILQHNVRAEGKTFPDFIRAHFHFFFQIVFREPVYLELLGRDPALFRRVIDEPYYLQGMEALRIDLDDAIERGLLAPIDTECLTASIMGIALEVGRVMIRRPQADPEAATRFATDLLLSGVAGRTPAS